MKDKNAFKAMIKDTLIIFAITLVTGLLLGVVYEITKKPIEEQEKQAKVDACNQVFVSSNINDLSFSEMSIDQEALKQILEEQGFGKVEIPEIYSANTSDGENYGYVIGVLTKEGYGGNIVFYVGIDNAGTVKGVSLLSISETPGLGMEAENVLVPQFEDKKAEQFKVTKNGAKSEDEIDAITSATITSKAVTNGVNAGLETYRQLKEGGILK